jgi:hypothetical protein
VYDYHERIFDAQVRQIMTTAVLPVDSIEREIVELLTGLPLDSKITVKQFVLIFVQSDATTPASPLILPLVTVPVAKLAGLIDLLSPGYEGNALADTFFVCFSSHFILSRMAW